MLLPLCVAAAFLARYESFAVPGVASVFWIYLAATVPLKLALLYRFGLYRRLWRYASVADLEILSAAVGACAGVDVVMGGVVIPAVARFGVRPSWAVLLLDACLAGVAITLPRLTVRVLARRDRAPMHGEMRNAVIVGAGVAGGMIVRELRENPQLGMHPVAILDDDPRKHGLTLHGVPVRGALRDLERVARDGGASDVVIAMPSAPGRAVRDVIRQASSAGLNTLTVPGLYELLSGEKRVHALRQIEIQDLLRREPINTDLERVASLVTGRVVMVTGAGGSIGSELCRQLARLQPSRIVALGRGENSIFELLREMGRAFPKVRVDPVIADCRDYARIDSIIGTYRPHSVFHAAAHKHVPLMEANVVEAVLNNVLGTQNVARLSAQYGVQHFVLISTDKAVRPTSVMGATKRLAELLVHDCVSGERSGYVSVRFGNVLGSRGSVVPTFLQQIAQGGPVTITHPDMTRYFMTIPEAVQLVLHAAALGRQGEVFVLDMGEPVRVFDLATDLIRLSGFEPGVEIGVQFTGARPGEKLYEELFFTGANITPTDHPKVLRARDAEAGTLSPDDLDELVRAARENRSAGEIRRLIARLVPEYSGSLQTGEFDVVLREDEAMELSGVGTGLP